MRTIVLCLALGGLVASVTANPITESYAYTSNVLIPDGDPLGRYEHRVIDNSAIRQITDLTVDLYFSSLHLASQGGFNSDLYVQLAHETGFAVLLNRVGMSASSPIGYQDEGGFSVSFNDGGSGAGDIHTYQLTLGGAPPAGMLTGTWETDGRHPTDANPVTGLPSDFDTAARTAGLSSFVDLSVNGDWTLFVADVVSDFDNQDPFRLNAWSLRVTGIPEPDSLSLLLLGLAGTLARIQQRVRKGTQGT